MICKGATYFNISDRTLLVIKNQQGVKQKLKAAIGTSSKSDLFNPCIFMPPQTVAIAPLIIGRRRKTVKIWSLDHSFKEISKPNMTLIHMHRLLVFVD
jgi:hypothetical protein